LYGTIEDLSKFGYTTGMELPGKILIKESLEPFNTENPEKDYKIAGKTGIVCCLDGQPIYRKTFYNASGTENDIFIAHNNGNAIKAAIKDNQEEVVETTEATEEFSL
jgi:hypothetical protein